MEQRRESRRAGAGAQRRGFTILELVLTLLALGIVTTLSIGAYFSRSEVTLQNAAELLASDLREAQTLSAIRRAPHEVHFHADGGGYHLHVVGSEGDPKHVRRYPHDAVFEDVQIARVLVEGGGRLSFDTLGRPSSDATITVVQEGVARSVLVNRRRARIAVEGE
jgi:prepilin-type N-terminal cleavage/methylation domain-containing protein